MRKLKRQAKKVVKDVRFSIVERSLSESYALERERKQERAKML